MLLEIHVMSKNTSSAVKFVSKSVKMVENSCNKCVTAVISGNAKEKIEKYMQKRQIFVPWDLLPWEEWKKIIE